MSIRGRTIIPGGACEFDLPSYYAWQKRPAEQRYDDIIAWFAPLAPLFDALALVLRLLRDSGGPVKMIADAGSYQQMLQGKVYQMLRLTLDENTGRHSRDLGQQIHAVGSLHQPGRRPETQAAGRRRAFELTLCNF